MKPSLSSRRKVHSQSKKPAAPIQDQRDDPPNSSVLIQSVEVFLKENPAVDKLFEKYEAGIESVKGVAAHFRKISRKEHHAALAVAYCIWLRSVKGGAYRNFVYEAELSRVKSHKNVSKLRVILENVISYGDDTEAGLRQAQRMYSRDEAAIRFLVHQGIGPDAVKSEADKKGAGLDKWSKSWSKINKTRRNASSESDIVKVSDVSDNLQDLDSFECENILITVSYNRKGHGKKAEKFTMVPSAATDHLLVHLKAILEKIQQRSGANVTSDIA